MNKPAPFQAGYYLKLKTEMTRALKYPSEMGQFWVGNEVIWASSWEVTARKSSLDPESKHFPMTRSARWTIRKASINGVFIYLVDYLVIRDVIQGDIWSRNWRHHSGACLLRLWEVDLIELGEGWWSERRRTRERDAFKYHSSRIGLPLQSRLQHESMCWLKQAGEAQCWEF